MSDLPPESEAVASDDQELVSLSNDDDDMNLQDGHLNVDELEETDGRNKANQLHCSNCDERYHQPRILQCLHVFCTPCLEKLAEEHGLGTASPEECKVIACPSCKQETRVGAIGKLPIDVIMMNMMDVADIREKRMLCTSCKAQEKAVARCCDCASFLCPNCVTAHKFMRCFENHKVDSFEDLLNGGHIDIHKPFFCSLHPVESVKFFCNSCQIPVCSECMLCMHKIPDHSCERIIDVEERQLKELQSIVTETKTKMNSCETMSADLEAMLADLQQQHDFAHDLIKETCQSYKAILDKRQESLLKELEEIHTTNELAIMDMFNNIQKTVERIDDGCQFTERILEHGNGVEILSLKKHVTQQLLTLLNNVPCLEPPIKVEFETDTEKFSAAVNATFGHFRRPSDSRKVLSDHHNAVSLQSSFEGDQFTAAGGLLSPLMAAVADFMPGLAGLASTSPDLTSGLAGIPGLPLHDSVVGKLGGILPAVSAAPLNMPSMQTGSTSAFQEHSMSRNSYSPAMSDSGISMDAASTGSLGGLNLNALSKLGSSFSVNAQGQITVNGQTIPGLNINSSTSGAPILASRALSLPPVSDSTSLAGLLSSVSLTPSAQLASPAAQLGDISSLLSNISPTTQQLFNMNVGGGTGGRDGSPITSAVTAANLLAGQSSSGLPLNGVGSQSSSHFGVGDAPLHPRSSGKTGAMQIRCKFGQLGPSKGQFNSPHGFCLGMDEDIVVADTNNHRIQIFEKSGEFKYQFGISGRDEGQLWYPRKVAVIRSTGKYVVCDRGSERSRMQLFTKTGQFIKKIGIRYIDIVAGLAISSQGHIVAVDSVSPTVFCINENGDLVRWFDCSDYMREPSDIAISGKEYYVCDFKGHCVVVFSEEGQFMHRIGCENITNYPNGIDISDAGDILVGDSHGNRFHIAVFQRDGSLIGEFECPYVKVSRCCGLKITSEGYVVTLAKNNQHVLVLNTLYIA